MDWMQNLSRAIHYIEENLTNEISVDDVSNEAYSSSSNFQRIFNMVTGITIGEYIRNRRLSMAGQELLHKKSKIIDVAMRYQYDTPESFSKAFARFHGISPSSVGKQGYKLKIFYPLTIKITIQGGFSMSGKLIDDFYWNEIDYFPDILRKDGKLTNVERYNRLVEWARRARGQNPSVFDMLTEWILDDSEWTDEKLTENEQILMQGVLARFKEQNTQLREYLKELEPSGVVNAAVFKALDMFDEELSGLAHNDRLRETVDMMFKNFSIMRNRGVRELIAGNKTGPSGTNSVEIFGYINYLKDCDAQVHWTLFMPEMIERQQKGFRIDSFEYKKMPAMRFIGREGDDLDNTETRRKLFRVLDSMKKYKSDIDYDVLFIHHYGLGVDVDPGHDFWGRFMKADTPSPEGFVYFDFIPYNDGKAGPPFCSQFAYSIFSGNIDAMHSTEGYDDSAMYDVTRNKILGQGITIPYPGKYWTAEVFPDGCDKYSTAFMFSVEL
jgi:AraC-like DNA-binding protein